MQPLPIALSAGLNALPPGLPKRGRTRAPLVDAALRRMLGDERVEELRGAGRYRRDVY